MYFDFAKAFDCVNHDLILQKLKFKFGIDGLLLQFIKEYLQGRIQQVSINGTISDSLPVLSGVPQGSIIGPLLFVLFIDDINACISEGTEIAIYADDTKIWREIKCDYDQIILQNDIIKLTEWSVANKMNFHVDKCKVIPVTNKPLDFVLFFNEFFYELNGKILDYSFDQKDLGVVIDRRLSWTANCTSLILKANKQLGFVKRTCHFIVNTNQRLALYISLVRSIFEHCCQVWAPYDKASINAIDLLQKRAVKWILKEQHKSYSDDLFLLKQRDLDLLPMASKFVYSDLVLFYKIVNKLENIKLPDYITRIEPQHIEQVTRSSQASAEGLDKLKFKCNVTPSVNSFKMGYFYRTVNQWNLLLLNLKTRESIETDLKKQLWLILGLKPD